MGDFFTLSNKPFCTLFLTYILVINLIMSIKNYKLILNTKKNIQ